MNKTPANRSSLFLMEIIIAILFFCVAGTVCIQLFVKSHLLTRESKELTMAVNEVTSAVSLVDHNVDLPTAIEDSYPSAVEKYGDYIVYYDDSWSSCSAEEGVYSLVISIIVSDTRIVGDISVNRLSDDSVIYQLDAGKHIPNRP